mmetsp:Transcript_20386/g.59101  ORF Transcript_20386/g.59101 Transcript_20386/m.59101 type:complete len:195 (+) Transcript_20386:49-633(+)
MIMSYGRRPSMGAASGAPCCNHATKELVVRCRGEGVSDKESVEKRFEDEVLSGDAEVVAKPCSSRGSRSGGVALPEAEAAEQVPEPHQVAPAAVQCVDERREGPAGLTKVFQFRGRQHSLIPVEDLSRGQQFHAEPTRLKDDASPSSEQLGGGRRTSVVMFQGAASPSKRKVARQATGYVRNYIDECDDDSDEH